MGGYIYIYKGIYEGDYTSWQQQEEENGQRHLVRLPDPHQHIHDKRLEASCVAEVA